MIATQSFEVWKGVLCGLYGLAVASAVPGLIYAFRASPYRANGRTRDWTRSWEPHLAMFVSCLGIVAAGVLPFLYQEEDTHQNIDSQKGLYYLMSVSWISIIWLTRIRVALNLSGCTKLPVRSISLGIVLSSCVLYLAHLGWMAAVGCQHEARIMPGVTTSAYCNAKKEGVEVIGIIVNFVVELALIGASVYALVLSKKEAASSDEKVAESSPRPAMAGAVLMLLFTILHCSFRYSPLVVGTDGILVKDMMMQLEGVASIMASNIPTLVACYFWLRKPSSTKPRPKSSSTFGHSRNSSLASTVSSNCDSVITVPANVIKLSELSPSKREHDRKLGLDDDDDISSLKSYRISLSVKVGETYTV